MVSCVAPTLIQEGTGNEDGKSPQPRAIEDKRAELAALPHERLLSDTEVAELRALGDNTGSMTLKGASAEYDGPALADRWPLNGELEQLAARWEIAPRRDLTRVA
jgi:hypothetical protein